MKDLSHDSAIISYFCANPDYAAAILADILKDGKNHELSILLRQIAGACSKSNDFHAQLLKNLAKLEANRRTS